MKACIFDLDGTLTDTIASLHYSVNATLQEMGLQKISEDRCKSYVGNGARHLISCALIAAGDKEAKRLEEGMEIYGRIFDANCTYHVTAYKGIPEVLTTLRKRGMKLGVLSNKPHVQTVKVVESIFGRDMFECIQGQQEGLNRKPNPDGVYKLLEQLHAMKEECLYIGDSEVDIQTGNNAGVKSIGVTWGFRNHEILAQAGAQHIIDYPAQLLAYIE